MTGMTLTIQDLHAIKLIVDDAIEDAMQAVAAGFEEVHKKFERVDDKLDVLRAEVRDLQADVRELQGDVQGLKGTVGLIGMQQRAMVDQLDDHSVRVGRLERRFDTDSS